MRLRQPRSDLAAAPVEDGHQRMGYDGVVVLGGVELCRRRTEKLCAAKDARVAGVLAPCRKAPTDEACA